MEVAIIKADSTNVAIIETCDKALIEIDVIEFAIMEVLLYFEHS